MKRLLSGALKRRRAGLSIAGSVVAASLLFVLPALADNIVRGFNEQGNLQTGWIVALTSSSTTVKAAPGNDPNQIYGVVVDPNAAAVAINQSGQHVFVATAGEYPVLVTTSGGTIKNGDYISVSNINGIGAKADNSDQVVLGQATSSFDGKTGVITTVNNEPIGQVNVNLNPGRSPILKEANLPGPLSKVSQAIAGHAVSPARVYGALIVFAIGALISSGILFVGVRSGLTAIGRNPLSRQSILMGLIQVIVVAIVVFILDLVGVYLLLRL